MVRFGLVFAVAEPAAEKSIAQNQPGVAEEYHVAAPVARLDEREIERALPARRQSGTTGATPARDPPSRWDS